MVMGRYLMLGHLDPYRVMVKSHSGHDMEEILGTIPY